MTRSTPREPHELPVRARELLAAARAVIFDFDGVIADTETLHLDVFHRTLQEIGVTFDAGADRGRFLGVHDRRCYEIALEETGHPTEREAIDRLIVRKMELYGERAHEIRLFPGLDALVRKTCARVPTTIASGSRRADLHAVLAPHDLLSLFPRLVAGEDVVEPKPSAECFLLALEILRERDPSLAPEDCLVFEDSVNGLEAARRAGMRRVGVTTSLPAERLEADLVVDSLEGWV